jgi:antirestriction protein ArdC
MKREEAQKLVENGIAKLNEALQSGRSETLERFLATLARFHNYSFGNAILIWSQKPEATQVAGFHAWRKLGRCVKKGEHGIAILAPMVSRKDREHGVSDRGGDKSDLIFGFRVAYVFDVEQTDGEPLPEFADATGDPGDWLGRLEESIREAGIELEYDFVPHGALGCSLPGKIIVRPDLAPSERFSVLAHEFAHELLHQRSERRKETNRRIRETEAEAVAYAVCLACGIDSTTRSADYIQLYRGDQETLKESLTYVQQTATQIISQLRGKRNGVVADTVAVLAA